MPALQHRAASIPDYARLAAEAVHTARTGGIASSPASAADGFYVDLGSIFDLGDSNT